MSTEFNINALMPQEMAGKAEAIGVRKAGMSFSPLLGLSILAGAFIGLGAMFATTLYGDSSTLPYGVARLLTGLILVIVGGAGLVSIMYWFIYLNPTKAPQAFAAQSASTHLDVGDGKAIKTRS